MTMSDEDAAALRAAVARGVEYLDRERPGWGRYVDLDDPAEILGIEILKQLRLMPARTPPGEDEDEAENARFRGMGFLPLWPGPAEEDEEGNPLPYDDAADDLASARHAGYEAAWREAARAARANFDRVIAPVTRFAAALNAIAGPLGLQTLTLPDLPVVPGDLRGKPGFFLPLEALEGLHANEAFLAVTTQPPPDPTWAAGGWAPDLRGDRARR